MSSVSLQLPDGGATMQSLQMPPTKASMNPKIERDVGVDAERVRRHVASARCAAQAP